jgi:hypothetical protein
MSPEALWQRYAATWSATEAVRSAELAACLADAVTYCDPNGLIEGREALSAYINGFQQSVPPGSAFRVRSVHHHNERTLAHWALHDPDDTILQRGTSFGSLSDDGRLLAITGFFYDAAEPQTT